MKKIIIILLILILLSNIVYAEDNKVVIEYFGVDACISCVQAKKLISETMDELSQKGYNIEFKEYNTMLKENEELLIKYNDIYNIPKDKFKLIPAVFVGEAALIDIDEVREGLSNTIENYKPFNIEDKINIASTDLVNITIVGIILAGLLDGINPCSIAMMLFFISFVLLNDDRKKHTILFMGLSFALGTMVAYLGIGIGLFRFIYAILNTELIMKGFYVLLLIMSVYLAIINIQDIYKIKNGKAGEIKNQLSKNTKKKIQGIIKKYNGNGIIYVSAFITAFVISFLEFFCTGQIYLPVISYMISQGDNSYLWQLLLYNIAFISPLLVITMFMHKGKEVIDISSLLVDKLWVIKLVGAMFFIGNAIYVFIRLTTI